jgi:hypothetical protein
MPGSFKRYYTMSYTLSRTNRYITDKCLQLNVVTSSPLAPFDGDIPAVNHFYVDRITGGWMLFRTSDVYDSRQKLILAPCTGARLVEILDYYLSNPPPVLAPVPAVPAEPAFKPVRDIAALLPRQGVI